MVSGSGLDRPILGFRAHQAACVALMNRNSTFQRATRFTRRARLLSSFTTHQHVQRKLKDFCLHAKDVCEAEDVLGGASSPLSHRRLRLSKKGRKEVRIARAKCLASGGRCARHLRHAELARARHAYAAAKHSHHTANLRRHRGQGEIQEARARAVLPDCSRRHAARLLAQGVPRGAYDGHDVVQ